LILFDFSSLELYLKYFKASKRPRKIFILFSQDPKDPRGKIFTQDFIFPGSKGSSRENIYFKNI